MAMKSSRCTDPDTAYHYVSYQ